MKSRKELAAWAGSIAKNLEKRQKERDMSYWATDMEILDRKSKLLETVKTENLRLHIIKGMQDIKDKYPNHLKNYTIPEK